jgi:hypothetical protein
MNVFTMPREHSSRCSPVQVGLVTTNNGSYPHEDTTTVTGRGGNGSGAPWMRNGRDVELTWETDGEKETKEMKLEECQISGVSLNTPLGLPDTRLPGIFSAQLFSERSPVIGRSDASRTGRLEPVILTVLLFDAHTGRRRETPAILLALSSFSCQAQEWASCSSASWELAIIVLSLANATSRRS